MIKCINCGAETNEMNKVVNACGHVEDVCQECCNALDNIHVLQDQDYYCNSQCVVCCGKLPKKISLNNGTSYIDVEDLKKFESKIKEKWEVIEQFMDSDIMNDVHIEISPCTEIEFLDAYLKKAKDDIVIG